MANINGTATLSDSIPQVDSALRNLESALNFLESVAPELVNRIETVLSPEQSDEAKGPEPGFNCSLAALVNQQANRVHRIGEYLHSVKSRVEL